MSSFFIVVRGYECFPDFGTIAEARHRLKEFLDKDMRTVKSRYGQATKIKDGEDNYRILIGDRHSQAIWSQYHIQEC